jgi:hypothetical protein
VVSPLVRSIPNTLSNSGDTETVRCGKCGRVGKKDEMFNFGGIYYCTAQEALEHWMIR